MRTNTYTNFTHAWRWITPFSAAVCLLLASGCAGSRAQFYPLDNPTAGGPAGEVVGKTLPPSDITVYITRRPPEAYRELGILSYPGSDPYFSQDRAITAFRQKAAEVGATGIIVIPSERWHEYDYPVWLPDRFRQTSDRRQAVHAYRAVAILEGAD